MSEQNINFGAVGMNLEQSISQLQKGKLTYALNSIFEGFDGQYVNYQNEQGNRPCVQNFPTNYKVIGIYTIYEVNKVIYFLTNPSTGDSEIGYSLLESCEYFTIINATCLNFDINHPILSVVHRADNCSLQVFWVDGYNKDRFLDLNNLPYKEEVEGCEANTTTEIDCNKLSINPFFSIPQLQPSSVDGDGTLVSGTYQFAIQYGNSIGEGYTSYYSITNPLPIFNVNNITLDFNTVVNKSITIDVSDLDNSGYFDYFNLIVIKTVNNIPSAELVGIYFITGREDKIIYTGQKITDISIDEVFQKYPLYEISNDITAANDVLIRDQLTSAERLSYQEIANKITILWQSYKLTKDITYKDELVAANLKGYMRDEVYALDFVPLTTDGRQVDKFPIPGRLARDFDLEPILNEDTVNGNLDSCDLQEPMPRWKVYNTANLLSFEDEYLNASEKEKCYAGPYQYGEMAYWESTEEYPCNPEIWGGLAGQKIRHHKFPDSLVTHIHDSEENIYPIGIKISLEQIRVLINQSSLSQEQKDNIAGFKIVRSNRANNKSVVAKGLLHNVGKYSKDNATYFYPNYPYNDRGPDPFISNASTALTDEDFPETPGADLCLAWEVVSCCEDVVVDYVDCTGQEQSTNILSNIVTVICSSIRPFVSVGSGNVTIRQIESDVCAASTTEPFEFDQESLNGFISDDSRKRFVFHSPDTHFYQPFLGNILKLETAEYGESKGHFVQTKDHAKYKLYTNTLFLTAIGGAGIIALVSRVVGMTNTLFDGGAFMLTYQTLVDIFQRLTPRINYAYHYSSIGNYTNFTTVPNLGTKQRLLDISTYMNPGMASVGDTEPVNNFQRESSVYLRSTRNLPYTDEILGVPKDESRWLPDCDKLDSMERKAISSYYSSIKKSNVAQYGQIHTYESLDTGYQFKLTDTRNYVSVFGGDIFINKFAYKSKVPFFIDNRVKSLDESDVFYNEIGNIGIPKFWFSLDSTLGGSKFSLFGVPVTNLHCQRSAWSYKRGRMYIFAYGIPNFFCESEVNVDYRQAFNDREGDFFPHVGGDIPDQWLQESFVSINYDNTYYYNKTYSKQNKENFFSSLPIDYKKDTCRTIFPYRAIFSEPRTNDPQTGQRNNWLIFKPISYFDFPQTYGKLISLDGIEYKQVMARFENRTQIYNALLTAPTSQASIYLGQSLFSQQVPPIDLADTDMGYIGTRHRFILKTEYGKIVVDDKRGHVFLVNGQQATNLVSLESGVEQFFNKYLEVQIVKYFPELPIDNHFNGVGIHGVYDAKYNRLILTKIDYIPINGVSYVDGKFYFNSNEIQLGNAEYFCNQSFTASYDFDNKSWISFHSYIPTYYIGSSNFFITGQDNTSWRHDDQALYNNFYGKIAPHTIEYPYAFERQDEILQSVSTYCKVYQYLEDYWIEIDDVFYNKAILFNNQQSSGLLNLVQKPKNNMSEYMKYPIYSTDSKTILFTKRGNLYNINQFWSLVKDIKQPLFKKTCTSLSFDKEINQENMNYSKMAFKKAPLRAKDLRCRFTLDNRSDSRIVSQFVITETQKSFI